MTEYGFLIIGGVLWNNVIVTHLLGLYPFLGERPSTVAQNGVLGLITTGVVTVTVAVGLLVRRLLLVPLEILYLEHLLLVVTLMIVLALVDLAVAGRAHSWIPEHLVLRVFLNSAALGIVILTLEGSGDHARAIVSALGLGLGVTVLLVLVQAIESRPETNLVPVWLRGMPLQFMTLGMIALALRGFAGIG